MYSKITWRPTMVHCWKRYLEQTIRRRRHGRFRLFERKTESIIREYCRRKKKGKKFSINGKKRLCILTSKETPQGLGYISITSISKDLIYMPRWRIRCLHAFLSFFFFAFWYFSLLFRALLIAICTSSLGELFASFMCSSWLKYILCVSNSLSAISFIISPKDSNCLFLILCRNVFFLYFISKVIVSHMFSVWFS